MTPTLPTIVLTGLESAGKSALFRGLSGQAAGDEANFRGSTVICRRCHLSDCACDLVDTPGIRTSADSKTTRLALGQVQEADIVLLVVRGTHAQAEVDSLLAELGGLLKGRRSALAITFEDKSPHALADLAAHYRESLGVPVVTLNARELAPERRADLLEALRHARPLEANASSLARFNKLPTVEPELTSFERPILGPLLALVTTVLLFAVPVYLAYILAAATQPLLDAALLDPLKRTLAGMLPPFVADLLGGSYGLFTLGAYSFLWAFPVVALMGVSVAMAEETGLKDRITAALDPALRRVGLSGRDLAPILSGFGCNVVAVFQSRACGSCTRKACVSMIAFGSACSYQIGASLSLFGSAGKPWLFAPYLLTLAVVGVIHTRLWHGAQPAAAVAPLAERAFLQWPRTHAVGWRVKSTVRQFLLQAMPIFLGICLVAGVLDQLGVLSWAAKTLAPAAGWFYLPGEVMPGILFSAVRKDGLLLLQQDQGGLVRSLEAAQLFVLVYLASTFTACMVTLWTVARELGARHALTMAGRQLLTSLASAWVLAAAFAARR